MKNTMKNKPVIRYQISKYGIYIAFLVLVLIMSFVSPYFFKVQNLINILNQVSIIGIIAIGSTIVLLSGGIDLSPGAIVALAGVLAAHFGHPGEYPLIVPVLVALSAGFFFGLINGVVTAKGKVPPFIVTLGMMSIARGLAMLACGGMQVINLSASYKALGGGRVIGIPILIVILAGIAIVFHFILSSTRFGRHIYAIGGNETAAHVSGLSVDRTKIFVYAIAATLSGLGGLLLSARTAVGSPIAGAGYELDAIAAAVIGGTSTTGGVGMIFGTIIGALIIQVISNGLDMINVPSYYQQIVKGIIIILAVYIDIRTKRKS